MYKQVTDKNTFLEQEQDHVLRLAGKILSKSITKSDDEFTIALFALSNAVDTYDESKGDFWKYANIVIRNRLLDNIRSNHKYDAEISIKPEIMEGSSDEEDDLQMQNQIAKQLITTTEESDIKMEIAQIAEELKAYDISFFDLAKCSPKAKKTRSKVAEIIRAIFLPPPLTTDIRKTKCLPAAKIMKRCPATKKILDNYRKYIISSVFILEGDYPQIQEYLKYIKEGDKDNV